MSTTFVCLNVWQSVRLVSCNAYKLSLLCRFCVHRVRAPRNASLLHASTCSNWTKTVDGSMPDGWCLSWVAWLTLLLQICHILLSFCQCVALRESPKCKPWMRRLQMLKSRRFLTCWFSARYKAYCVASVPESRNERPNCVLNGILWRFTLVLVTLYPELRNVLPPSL